MREKNKDYDKKSEENISPDNFPQNEHLKVPLQTYSVLSHSAEAVSV